MKYFTKIFFTLILSSVLFAENESALPASDGKDPIESIDNPSIGCPVDSANSVLLDTSTPAVDTTMDEDSSSTNASEEESPLEDIRDIRAAVDLPIETWQIVALSCLILALLLGLWYIFKQRRAHNQGISVIPLDPYHKALQELEAALQLIQSPDQRPFATGITDAVRGYLAAVFSLPAPECTTEEVLEQLPGVALFTEEIRHNISQLLRQCDLAKFAKIQFEQPERIKLYHQAKAVIQSADKLIQLQNANTIVQ